MPKSELAMFQSFRPEKVDERKLEELFVSVTVFVKSAAMISSAL